MNVPAILWEHSMQRFLAARIAEVEYDEKVWAPAWDDNNCSMSGPAKKQIDIKMEELQEARHVAEDALILTPTNAISNVRWKLAYCRIRYEGFCDFPDDWWQAIYADLERIAAGGAA